MGDPSRRRTVKAINLLLPFTPVRARWLQLMLLLQACLAIALWALSGSTTLPSPMEAARAWVDLVQRQGLLFELWASVKVSVIALLVSTLAAVAVACLSTAPVFMPAARLSAAMRFLGFAGLTYVFMLASGDAHSLRVAILSFGMFVFMVTSLLAEIAATPRERIDHCRTLGMRHWRITAEVVLLGKADVILDLMRQNAAVGWTLLTLVEGMTRSEGGIGAMLLNQNRYFLLAGVFAIQLTILTYGLVQDALLSLLRDSLCPYGRLGQEGVPA
jgi:NitT/TauT family transport system permease protein